ncbi:MAG: ABC transporter permease [Candidatus Berkelbacteria bacterium]|nr:ABC transporter permease [Candidatus Berkelbacteria bacterium]
MFRKLFIADLKMMARNRQALFWAFMFPLIFTFIFGLFFGKNTSVGTVALINDSNTQLSTDLSSTLQNATIFKIQKEKDVNVAKDEIAKSKIAAIVYIPNNFGLLTPEAPKTITIISDQANAQTSSVISSFVNQFLTQANYQIQNAKPIFQISEEKTSNKTLTYFDFVFAGILGLALMNSSVIGIAVGMSKYREDKILKRITTTPLPSYIFVVAEVLSRLILNLFQVGTIVIIGKYVFDVHIYGNIFVVFGLALIGGLLFQLMGFVVSSFSKTTDAAQGMATAITIPMMFLAGVFFPIDTLPKWLYSIVQYLPLAPLLRMLRAVTNDGTSPFANPVNIVIVSIWILVCLAISIFRFKLSEE